MSTKKLKQPDYIFETGWEVCNKIGGIHTVISSKAPLLTGNLNDQYIVIGPDVWKETHRNPEFAEDHYLFRSWREHAASQGLHFRIGRWQVPGNPIAILVDFTPLFGQKNEIFKDYWDKFELNSLSGQWDYTEPALFGYAAGQVIESFYHYYMTAHDHFIAHFHEWLTGTGVLYLKDRVPQASTVFTTHATVLGRSIAGSGQDLYTLKEEIDPGAMAAELGIVSKFSLEKVTAHHADSFTTVSEGIAGECRIFLEKEPDVITPNGFHHKLVASGSENAGTRVKSRQRLIEVAKGLLNTDIADDSLLLLHSGRYEFRNKGTDLLIDALGELNQQSGKQTIVAFILVPDNQGGPLYHVA
ncbi:MAG: glycogen/starch synthase, partial [Bacteroidales bacterium]